MADAKISLPKFLKILTSNAELSVNDAMEIASKIYKTCNTAARLSQLDSIKLVAAGVTNKDKRKLVMDAVRKAGYLSRKEESMSSVQQATTPSKRKRKRPDDANEFLPGPHDEASTYGSLEFNEVLDQEILSSKSTIINRAPIMTAWAMVVAERMGFQREEALSIASVYTEMNAISKGVSIGVYNKGKEKDLDASKGGSQPYVQLIGRRSLYQTQTKEWRALSGGEPVLPSAAFSYISRSFRQTTPHIIGALRLLAQSFPPKEINEKAWDLYTQFRPKAEGWGQRSEVKCTTILGLRRIGAPATLESEPELVDTANIVGYEMADDTTKMEAEPEGKRPKTMTLEEYETFLDESIDDNLDLSNIP